MVHNRLLSAILWIPSGTFFAWITRRLVELKDLQLNVARIKPPNLGLLSALLVYLMQHVMTTPLPKHRFMNNILANVKFALVIGESGMFFLRGLDLETLKVDDVDSSDPEEVKSIYKVLKKAPSKRPVPKRLTLTERALSNEFPWGRAMSWTMIKFALEDSPTRFIREWTMDPSWEVDSQGQAASLFMTFTRDVWLTISEKFVSMNLVPKPTSLEEAMQAWSVEFVNKLLRDKVTFIASSCGLQGALPVFYKRDISFAQRRAMFFPTRETATDKKSVWSFLGTVEGAYLREYHHFVATSNSEAIAVCHQTLDTIFSHLQCLPSWESKSVAKYTGAIWASTFHKVIIVTNPGYYKVEQVRQEATETHQPTRPQAPARLVEARLELEHNGRVLNRRRRRNNKQEPTHSRKRKEVKEVSKELDKEASEEESSDAGGTDNDSS